MIFSCPPKGLFFPAVPAHKPERFCNQPAALAIIKQEPGSPAGIMSRPTFSPLPGALFFLFLPRHFFRFLRQPQMFFKGGQRLGGKFPYLSVGAVFGLFLKCFNVLFVLFDH